MIIPVHTPALNIPAIAAQLLKDTIKNVIKPAIKKEFIFFMD